MESSEGAAGKAVEEEEGQSSSSVGDSNIGSKKDPSEPTKGKGLKKWRRIQRRDFASPAPNSVDPNRILKRDSKSVLDGSAVAKFTLTHAAADSDNSEDPPSSNKSSTAASVPKLRSHRSNRAPTPPSRTNSARYSGKRAEKVESTKKHRGGIDRDASYSSVESDLRSSGRFFSEIANGNGSRVNFDPDNWSEAQASDQQSNEYLFRDNGEEEVSQSESATAVNGPWGEKEQGSCNQPPLDPFTESILALQAVHDALEKEIQNFGEIGKEPIGLMDDSTNGFILNPELHSVVSESPETNSSGNGPIVDVEKSCSLPLGADLIKINHKVYTLESKLEEAMAMLETKESRIVELEGNLNEREIPKTEQGKEIESELEDLFRDKIEAEVEYLTMRKTSQKLKLASEDQIALFEEQRTLINEQNKILQNFREAENNIQTEKHKLASSGEPVETEEVMKMQRKLCKYSCCLASQLMLLLLVFGLIFFPLWPGPTEFAPT